MQRDTLPLRNHPDHQHHSDHSNGDPDRPKQVNALPPEYFERVQKMTEKMVCQESSLLSMAAERNTTRSLRSRRPGPMSWNRVASRQSFSEGCFRMNIRCMVPMNRELAAKILPPTRPEIFPSAFWIPDMIEQYEENPLGHEPEIERVIDRGQALPVKLPKFGISALQGRLPRK